MIRQRSYLIFGFIFVLIVVVFPSFSWSQPKEVKIGILNPITGPLAKIGETNMKGWNMAVEDVNAAGGIKALGGAKLRIVWGDHQTKSAICMTEAERLIKREKVPILIYSYASGVCIPCSTVAEKLKTPFFAYISVAEQITGRGYKYLWRLNAPASQWSRAQIEFIADMNKKGYNMNNIALLYEDTDWGQDTAKAHRKFAKEYGLKIVADESYPRATSDLTVKLMKIKMANPDVLIPTSYINDAILIAETRERIGWQDVNVLHGGGGALEPEYTGLGKIVEKELTVSHFNYDTHEAARKINDRFKEKYGTDMNGNAAIAYQAIIVVREALEMAKSMNKEKIRNAMNELHMEPGPKIIMPYDKIDFDAKGENNPQLVVVQNVGGRFVTVWPDKFAHVKPKLF